MFTMDRILPVYDIFVEIIAIILTLWLHEYVRAFVSYRLGDISAKEDLSLNPFHYFDLIGFLLYYYTKIFGFTKTVKISALHYRDRKKGVLITVVLACLANFCACLLAKIFYSHSNHSFLNIFLVYFCYFNFITSLTNLLIPFSPWDLSRIIYVYNPNYRTTNFFQFEKLMQACLIFSLIFLRHTHFFIQLQNNIIQFIF